jgi:hypothetical protein
MSTTTPNFGLTLPAGGPPGVGDPISRTQLNANWTLLDTLARAVPCTSTTRPSSPFPGQVIYETDTKVAYIRNAANTSWTQWYGVPTVSNTSDIAAPFNGQVVWSYTGFGMYVYKSSTTTWTPLTHDQYFTYRQGVTTSISNTAWTPVPFVNAGEGGSQGISTSDNITWTLNEPGVWTVGVTLVSNSNISFVAALYRGTINDPFNVANSEIYSMASCSPVQTVAGLTLTADIRVATGGSRTVRCTAIGSATFSLVSSGPIKPRISFKWAPL